MFWAFLVYLVLAAVGLVSLWRAPLRNDIPD